MKIGQFRGRHPTTSCSEECKAFKSNGDDSSMDPLDELLLPLIDKSISRQMLIRTTEAKGDYETLDELERVKSRRHTAKESTRLRG